MQKMLRPIFSQHVFVSHFYSQSKHVIIFSVQCQVFVFDSYRKISGITFFGRNQRVGGECVTLSQPLSRYNFESKGKLCRISDFEANDNCGFIRGRLNVVSHVFPIADFNPLPELNLLQFDGLEHSRSAILRGDGSVFGRFSLPLDLYESSDSSDYAQDSDEHESYVWGIFRSRETLEIALRFTLGPVALYGGAFLFYYACNHPGRYRRWILSTLAIGLIAAGLGAFLLPIYWQDACHHYHDCQTFQHNR